MKKNRLYYLAQQEGTRYRLYQDAFTVAQVGAPLLTRVAPTLFEVALAVGGVSYQYGFPIGLGLSATISMYTAYCALTTKLILMRMNLCERNVPNHGKQCHK